MAASTPAAPRHPFTNLKIVEIAADPAGELVGRLFAELGAEVTKLEPPGGSPSRKVGPFAKGKVGPDCSLNFWFYNGGKKSVICDLGAAEGRAALDARLEGADLLISTLQPSALTTAGLNYVDLNLRFPRLIILSVTPFGLTGPWAEYKSSDLVALAAAGPLLLTGYDDHTIPPIKPGGDQAFHTCASFGYSGAMLALIDRQRTGRGQLVDVAMHECCAVSVEMAFPYWAYQQAKVFRQTCRHAQPSMTQPSLFPCADGRYLYYVLIIAEAKPWNALVEWLESYQMAADLADPVYQDLRYRQDNFFHIQNIVECFFLTIGAEEAFKGGQARELPIGVVYAPEDLLVNEHFSARNYFVEVEEDIGSVVYPGVPYRFSAFDLAPRVPAPKLATPNLAATGAGA